MSSYFPQSLNASKELIGCFENIGWVHGNPALSSFSQMHGSTNISFLALKSDNIIYQTEQAVNLITSSGESGFSILDLCSEALKFFDFEDERDQKLNMAVFTAAALSDVPNGLSYHNNFHFFKVVLHVVRMISAHNFIFEGGKHALNKEDVAQLLIAACIHDLGHNGKGNIIDRKYSMAATEMRSYGYALPFLEKCNLDKVFLEDIKFLLFCTDASPFGDPISPSMQLRRSYNYHFGDEDMSDDLMLSSELSVLENREDLVLKCMLLHEADLMNSLGVSYDLTVAESIAVSCEIGTDPTPEGTLLFFEKNCENDFFSDSGRFLGQENFRRIRLQVLKDYNAGNKPYSA